MDWISELGSRIGYLVGLLEEETRNSDAHCTDLFQSSAFQPKMGEKTE